MPPPNRRVRTRTHGGGGGAVTAPMRGWPDAPQPRHGRPSVSPLRAPHDTGWTAVDPKQSHSL
jgi:hypothetical protein